MKKNQFLLTAHLLVTDSNLIRFGIALALIFAGLLAYWGAWLFALLVVASLAQGIGHSTRMSRRWELTKIVPEMNQRILKTSLLIAFALSVSIAIVLIVNQFSGALFSGSEIRAINPVPTAATVLATAFGLWFGGGDRIRYLTSFVMIILLTAIALNFQWLVSVSSLSKVSGLSYNWTFACLVGAAAFLFRYLHQANSLKSWPQSNHYSLTSDSIYSVQQLETTKLAAGKSRPHPITRNSFISRIDQLCHDFPTRFQLAAMFLLGIGLVALLYLNARDEQKLFLPLAWFSIVALVISPTGLMMYRVKESFELLWMTGIGSRTQTIRSMMRAMMIRVGVLFVFATAVLLAIVPWQYSDVSQTLVIVLLAGDVGVVCLLVAGWTRKWWAAYSDYAFAGLAVMATLGAAFCTIPLDDLGVVSDTNYLILPGMVLSSVAVWILAFYLAPMTISKRVF